MAFWGVEVRPGKPYTHLYDDARGRLRICQATLGDGKAARRSSLQCNVGNKSPILICSLIPEKTETCHLELEFEENEEVVFSVLGERSVHISGYYLGSSRGNGGDETDSYGEDIGEEDSADSDESFYSEDDDEYESDFIDDGDIEMFTASPKRKSSVVIEEILDDDKLANGNGAHRRLKKKHQLSDTDDGDDDNSRQLVVKSNTSAVIESEDEDGFPLTVSLKKKNDIKNNVENRTEDDKAVDEDRKRKIDALEQAESARKTLQTHNSSLPSEVGPETNGVSKKKKKAKDGKPVEMSSGIEPQLTHLNQIVDDKVVEDVTTEKDTPAAVEMEVTENDGKLKKKRERAKKAKTCEMDTGLSSVVTEEAGKEDPNETTHTDSMDQDQPPEAEKLPNIEDGSNEKLKKKSKKKRVKDQDQITEDIAALKDVQGGNQQNTGDKIDLKNAGLNKDSKNDLNIDEDLTVSKLPQDKVFDDTSAVQQESKKKKKKKSKNDKDLNSKKEPSNLVVVEEKAKPQKSRTFPNGLTIEEISMGKPDGKKASSGKKVFVNYIGKLQNGKIFDSNVAKRPFKFRLGIGEVIKGWDVGINGMRIGDKRRLTIPPSMGYGQAGAGEKIPGNSWLVFDVELVDVQ